jgi:hypothetical protein
VCNAFENRLSNLQIPQQQLLRPNRELLFCSVALLEHLSTQSARELLVAVVPALVPRDAREVILDDSIEPLSRLQPSG